MLPGDVDGNVVELPGDVDGNVVELPGAMVLVVGDAPKQGAHTLHFGQQLLM